MICPGLLPIQDRLGMTADSTQPRVNKWWCSGVIVVTGLGLDNSAVALTGHTPHRDLSSNKITWHSSQSCNRVGLHRPPRSSRDLACSGVVPTHPLSLSTVSW